MTSEPHLAGETIDDLLRRALKRILDEGEEVVPTRGAALELVGVLLELSQPRARLSRTETRGKPYSCLGELCWYLAKSDDLAFISHYIPRYKDYNYEEGPTVAGAYGPRLFAWDGIDQLANVVRLLSRKRSSRQAVAQLFGARDIASDQLDVPCTCTLQFLVRSNALHMLTMMRSNDAFLGLPHDFFTFTMIQEIISRELGVELGTYKHFVGSLHLYEANVAEARGFLSEGWQSTSPAMPPMPSGDPWPAIARLLEEEARIRGGDTIDPSALSDLDSYWADLVRLLEVFQLGKSRDATAISALRERITFPGYHAFVDMMINRLGDGVQRN